MTDSPLEVPIRQLWIDLGGELPKTGGNYVKAFWRQSDSANIQLLPEKNKYIDHARGDIGGPVKLVATVLRKSHSDAIKYLHQHYGNGIVTTPRYTRQAIEQAEQFRIGYIALLDAALARFHIDGLSPEPLDRISHYTGIRMSLVALRGDLPRLIENYQLIAKYNAELATEAVQLGREQRAWVRQVGELALSAPQQPQDVIR